MLKIRIRSLSLISPAVIAVLSALVFVLPCRANDYSAAGIDNAAPFDRFYEKLRAAVTSNDIAAAAALFHYPMDVGVPKGSFGDSLHLRNRADFVKYGDILFPPALRQKLKVTDSSALWANWQGVAMPAGEIWFNADEKGGFVLSTINVPSARQKPLTVAIPKNFPRYVFGSYQICEVKEVGGHLDPDKSLNKTAMNKHFSLSPGSVSADPALKFLISNCKSPKYEVERTRQEEGTVGEQGTLSFYGFPAKDPALSIAANSKQGSAMILEVAADNRLAGYFDGWMFFAKKVAPQSKSVSGARSGAETGARSGAETGARSGAETGARSGAKSGSR